MTAKLIKTDGTTQRLVSKKSEGFTIEEINEAIGGEWYEHYPVTEGIEIFFDEEGLLKGLPPNPRLKGLVGNVLLMSKRDWTTMNLKKNQAVLS